MDSWRTFLLFFSPWSWTSTVSSCFLTLSPPYFWTRPAAALYFFLSNGTGIWTRSGHACGLSIATWTWTWSEILNGIWSELCRVSCPSEPFFSRSRCLCRHVALSGCHEAFSCVSALCCRSWKQTWKQ